MKELKLTYHNPEKITGEPALFKIWVGKKYYIWKLLNLNTLKKVTAPQIAKEMGLPKSTSIFYKLVMHAISIRAVEISVEIIGTYNDNFELLKDEYELLKAAKKDKYCLNQNFINHDKYPSWISQEAINQFKTYYTKGKNVGSSAKDKRLLRFLNTHCEKELTGIIYKYVKDKYK